MCFPSKILQVTTPPPNFLQPFLTQSTLFTYIITGEQDDNKVHLALSVEPLVLVGQCKKIISFLVCYKMLLVRRCRLLRKTPFSLTSQDIDMEVYTATII